MGYAVNVLSDYSLGLLSYCVSSGCFQSDTELHLDTSTVAVPVELCRCVEK